MHAFSVYEKPQGLHCRIAMKEQPCCSSRQDNRQEEEEQRARRLCVKRESVSLLIQQSATIIEDRKHLLNGWQQPRLYRKFMHVPSRPKSKRHGLWSTSQRRSPALTSP